MWTVGALSVYACVCVYVYSMLRCDWAQEDRSGSDIVPDLLLLPREDGCRLLISGHDGLMAQRPCQSVLKDTALPVWAKGDQINNVLVMAQSVGSRLEGNAVGFC